MRRIPFTYLLASTLCPIVLTAQEASRVHVVKAGDTMPRLVWVYGVSAERIRAANGLASDSLAEGSTLQIPTSAPSPVKAPPPPEEAPVEPQVRMASVSSERAMAVPSLPAARAEPYVKPAPPAPAARLQETPPVLEQERTGQLDSSALVRLARALESKRISYGQSWRPPGEDEAWEMDCSNTARYVYRVLTNLEIGRTASDQYVFLQERRRVWKAPRNPARLLRDLRPGDLLFWEHTYKPARKPPITHVMIYLGKDRSGRHLMFGSQSRRTGGPGIYPFDPQKHSGGYSTWLGIVRHRGRFVAYGRPVD